MISSPLSLLIVALPTVLGATINVQVGANGTVAYDPPSVSAAPGDTINFLFDAKNHTVTQSSFNTPCIAAQNGFNTDFVPITAGAQPVTKSFTVPPGNTPLWFYCRQTGHCGQGMVFAINAPADPAPNSFSAFQAAAIAQNGTAASAPPPATPAPAAPTAGDDGNFTTPPAPVWATATATVAFQGSTYTTVYSSYLGTPPPTPAAVPQDHTIIVGFNGTLTYNPPNITAAIGDTVTFEFHPKNHTVTQSSFLTPCEALQKPDGTAGFKSGFMPVEETVTSGFPTFQIKINDTAPIWGYCGQTGHCEQGMVFAINAVESGPNNFETFVELAKLSNTTSSSNASSTTAPGSSPTNSSGAFAPRAVLPMSFGLGFAGLVLALMI